MVDEKKPFVNPLDDENFTAGGGLWDGKTVTVIGSKFTLDPMTYKDGSPVINEKSGQPAIRHVWEIEGIADDEEKSRRETYSIGGLLPTADGESFTKADGTIVPLHANSEAAKFSAGIKSGGFDMSTLFDVTTGRVIASKLVGARFVFTAVARLDKDGNIKKNAKGYEQNSFYPTQFVGIKDGVTAPGAAAAPVDDETRKLAVDTVAELLKGGPLAIAEIVRGVSKALVGNPKVGEVASLILDPSIDAGAPWTRDGATLSLS